MCMRVHARACARAHTHTHMVSKCIFKLFSWVTFSLSFLKFSSLAFSNPQAAVSFSKYIQLDGGAKNMSPTDECNLQRKYAFYQRPHVANAN